MKGKLLRLGISFDENGGLTACDIAHGRVAMADFGDGPEETMKSENVSLSPDDVSEPTAKLLQSLGDALIADLQAAAKKRAAAAQQVAADLLKEAQRAAAEAKAAADAAAAKVTAPGGG